jgi:hypothetical protein
MASEVPVPRRRWRRWLFCGAVVAVLVVAHPLLFRLVAWGLIHDDPLAEAEAVVFGAGNGPFEQFPLDEAAALYHDGYARRVVVLEDRSARLVRLGVVPPIGPTLLRELAGRGVPEGDVELVPVRQARPGEAARCLRDWLERHPGASVTVLCSQLESNRAARAFGRVLDEAERERVRWRAIPDDRCLPGNWWHSRQGVTKVTGAYVALAFLRLRGQDAEVPVWDPDEYEQELRRR